MTTDHSSNSSGNSAFSGENAYRQDPHEAASGAPDHEGEDTANAQADEDSQLVRFLEFDAPQPIALNVRNGLGPVRVELTDTAVTRIEVRHDPDATDSDWRSGLTGLLTWVTEQFGEAGLRTGLDAERYRARESATEAVRRTQIDMTGNRLTVDTPSTAPLRNVPLLVRVQAPTRSDVSVHNSTGEISVHGTAGQVQIQAGSGTVSLSEATERATVRTGSGQLRLGNMAAGVHARSGSGNVEVASLTGASSVVTGSADVSLGEVHGHVLVRSGSGDASIAAAVSGELEVITGSGEVQVAIRRGCAAEVDLTSSSGTARSNLDVSQRPPENDPELRIFGRTGSGNAALTSTT